MQRMKGIAVSVAMCLLMSCLSFAQAVSTDGTGLSAEPPRRINAMIDRRIEAKDISGAVTLVARRGKIAHFEAQGLMDIETNKPMTRDAIFRIASMTKPVVGVAILMMLEEGKVRLTDNVSRYI